MKNETMSAEERAALIESIIDDLIFIGKNPSGHNNSSDNNDGQQGSAKAGEC